MIVKRGPQGREGGRLEEGKRGNRNGGVGGEL